MPIIKKHKNNNEYILTDAGVWVRNSFVSTRRPIDINSLWSEEEYSKIISNELANKNLPRSEYISETKKRPLVVIVSSGYQFEEKQKLLSNIEDISVFAVNKALQKWEIANTSSPKMISYYVINNPFEEALKFLPKKKGHKPKCISSIRTHPGFIESYKGYNLFYTPTPDQTYSGLNFGHYDRIDDYRNPVCSALHLAQRMGAQKILLFCCDDSFIENRPGSFKLKNGLFSYPQQIISSQIIDGVCYWLKSSGIEVRNYSSGPDLNNAAYIDAENLGKFFKEDNYE